MSSSPKSYEVVIVGAGIIGSAVAMSLGSRGVRDVLVVDYDLEGTLSSSELNAGGVRATFIQPLNVEMSIKTIEYLALHGADVGYRDCGYLWLCDQKKLDQLELTSKVQLRYGWPIEKWSKKELREKVPLIDKGEDLVGAFFSPRDGLINTNLLKVHYRNRAKNTGVIFQDRTALLSCEKGANGFELELDQFESPQSHEQKLDWLSGHRERVPKKQKIRTRRVINCAGAWAGGVAKILGYSTPSFAVRRQISIFDGRGLDLSQYGMMIEPGGVYFHPEAMNGLAGFANHAEPRGINYEYGGESFFIENIWPALYEHSSQFEELKHLTGWAGQYEVSPDESAILGEVPHHAGLYDAHSFSGHGVMHSFAAGEALAELICEGRYSSIDAGPFSGLRFLDGKILSETAVI